jgi:hypothetical protein
VYLCTLTITFNEGLGNENSRLSITGSYLAPFSGAAAVFSRAITGGTGKYFGATGNMRSTDLGSGLFKHELKVNVCKYLSRR